MSDARNNISIAIFHPRMGFGGSEACAMWALEALKRDYRIALVAGGRIDLPALNAFYGTSIDPAECETVEIPLPRPLAHGDWGAALRGGVVARGMRRHFNRFDVLISSYNINRFDRAGIHYVADFSWDETLRSELDPLPRGARSLVHRNPVVRRLYLGLASRMSGVRRNSSPPDAGTVLATSSWTAEVLRTRHGIEASVLYPPLAIDSGPPPERKFRRFVCLGRISPEKRIERMIEILRAVRARGHDVTLHIIGDTRETPYGRQIERRCRGEGDWLVLEGRQFGEAKAHLLENSAFGIHGCRREGFGIAVAEMITAGCIPFVPAEGGPAEIVEHNPALVYATADEAVEKINAMLRSFTLERVTREALLRRARDFSTEAFMRGVRSAVNDFVGIRGNSCERLSVGPS